MIENPTGDNGRKQKSFFEIISKRLDQLSGNYDCPTPITDLIYLGDRHDAQNKEHLKSLGITHILNTAKQLPNYHEGSFEYFKINILDKADQDIKSHLNKACAWMKKALSSTTRRSGRTIPNKVLVHCVAGCSRSTTVVIAYLMKANHVRLREAFHLCRARRPIVHPNEGFRLQLCLYELEVFKESSVARSYKGSSTWWNFYDWNQQKNSVPHFESKKSHCTIQ